MIKFIMKIILRVINVNNYLLFSYCEGVINGQCNEINRDVKDY